MSQTIICPSCHTHIDLDKLADEKYSARLREQEEKLKREQEKQRESFEKEMETRTEEMRKKAQEFADKKANEERKKVELEMKDMTERLEKAEKQREESQKKELEMMRRQRELEDKEKNLELEMEKRSLELEKKLEDKIAKQMQENSQKKLEESMEKMQEEFRKKELEYQKQQEQMKKSVDDWRRKAEQGSQQIQGDIQEDDLKNSLSQNFPLDKVEDVPTGIKGADLIQTVQDNFGSQAGVIVWESKNTQSWQDAWIMKLKEDSLKVNGNISIIVTAALPKNIKHFGMIDGVMVCAPAYALAVAEMLRNQILAVHKTAKSLEGKDVKMEMLYKYLASPEFGGKIAMMVDVFANLKTGIDTERRAMERNWKRREKDLERATFAVTGMYGELESLMGMSLPGADMLELSSGEDEDLFDNDN